MGVFRLSDVRNLWWTQSRHGRPILVTGGVELKWLMWAGKETAKLSQTCGGILRELSTLRPIPFGLCLIPQPILNVILFGPISDLAPSLQAPCF